MNLTTALARLSLVHTRGPRVLEFPSPGLHKLLPGPFSWECIMWLVCTLQTPAVARRKLFARVWVVLAHESVHS